MSQALPVSFAARRSATPHSQTSSTLPELTLLVQTTAFRATYTARSSPLPAQSGFSLVEVAIVTAIVLLVAILGMPAIGTYVIENKVPKVGEALQRFVLRMQVNAQGTGPTPYAGIGNGILANALRDSSVFDLAERGAAPVVSHGLSRAGGAGAGTVTLGPVVLSGAGMGSGFSLTLSRVNDAACPALASVMQGVSSLIRVENDKGSVTVKDDQQSPPVRYSAARTAGACSDGDVNTFVFIAR